MSDDLQGRLNSYYARTFPARPAARVTALAPISAGWESDMYSFTVESGPPGARQCENLILRIYPGAAAHSKSAREYRGMSLLYEAGFPVPQVLVLERKDSPFGGPFVIMERIEGQMLWPVWFGSTAGRQQELLTLFCRLFVRLHTLEWGPFADALDRPSGQGIAGSDGSASSSYADRELDRLRPYLARYPIPGFLPVVEWLEARRDIVPCERPSVVHWDYHPGNLLLREDGSAVVVDWTQVGVSDPRFDLAWTLLLVSTHQDETWHGRILQEYERLAGAKVRQLAFFEVYACLKRLYSVVVSLAHGPESLGMRPGAGTMMVEELGAIAKVYDLLLDRAGIRVPEVEELLAQVS